LTERISADVGALLGLGVQGVDELTGGFTARLTWPIADAAELGLRQTIHFAVLPYKIYDALPVTSARSEAPPPP
jgi:hypothetical protein